MPRGPSVKEEIENLCYLAWQSKRASILNGTFTIKEIYDYDLPIFLEKVKTEEWPGLSWFTKRVTYRWEPNALIKPLEPDPIVEEWDEKWWNSPKKIYVLTTLYDQAYQAVAWEQSEQNERWDGYNFYEFNGFTDRVCKWAWKLSEFFDLNLSHERSLLILIANLFAYEERRKLEYPGQEVGVFGKGLRFASQFPLGRHQLRAWRRHKMGYEPEAPDVTWLWQHDTKELWRSIPHIAGFGQVLLIGTVDWETDEPRITAVIEG